MVEGGKSPIRAVLTDFGGVLYRWPEPRWLLLLARLMRRKDGGMVAMMQQSPTESTVVNDIMTGKMPEQEVWQTFARQYRIPAAWLARMRRGAVDPKRLNLALIDALTGLRQRMPVVVLTNAGTEFRSTFVQAYRLEELFDEVIISAEVGLAKPDPAIYHLAAERLNLAPQNVLMIDDRAENITGAQQAGMQGLLFETTPPAIEKIAALTALR